MAKRTKVTEQSMTAVALQGEKALTAWLDQNPIYIYEKGTPQDDRVPANAKSSTPKRCVFQVDVPASVYVAMVREGSEIPGAMKDGDLVDGTLARVARRALLPQYTDIGDVEEWENKRAEESSHRRGQRMQAMQAEVKKAKTIVELLREGASSNPELAAALAAMKIDLEA